MPNILNNQNFNILDIKLFFNDQILLSDKVEKIISSKRTSLDTYIQDKVIYGINTGFGSLCNKKIEQDKINILQVNLLRSHACGVGNIIDIKIIKLMLLLKIITLSKGYSGVSLDLLNEMIFFYNNNILPVVYEYGSLGASGDLVPLAHLSLPLIGEGEVFYNNSKILTKDLINKIISREPLELKSKEGLALINGTQYITASAVYAILEIEHILAMADLISCISLEAFDGLRNAFHEGIHNLRPYNGQISTAKKIREILNSSELFSNEKPYVQDPYSFRCIPQVHGATKDVYDHFVKIIEIEINSVTDNPLLFSEDNNNYSIDSILSGGNFHGQPLALVIDYMSIAIAEIGNISERRLFQLVSGERGLPPFLTENPGLNSGFMIVQYTAASLVSINKQFATPSSIDSIVSSNGQEDHVSMGANSAIKLIKIIDNVKQIISLEMLTAFQALEFRLKISQLKISTIIQSLMNDFRKDIPFIQQDSYMKIYIDKSIDFYKLMKPKLEENKF